MIFELQLFATTATIGTDASSPIKSQVDAVDYTITTVDPTASIDLDELDPFVAANLPSTGTVNINGETVTVSINKSTGDVTPTTSGYTVDDLTGQSVALNVQGKNYTYSLGVDTPVEISASSGEVENESQTHLAKIVCQESFTRIPNF